MTTEAIETTAGELELYEPPATSLTLFGTSDPALALERMATIARLLDGVIRERKLVQRIAGNEYVRAPGWAVLGGMTGLAPYTVWVKPLEDGTGWMARVEVRRVADGVTIAAAEQLCSRAESKWARAADHALCGMAQTRATRRALMGPLQQVVELAGYAGGEPPDETAADEPEPDRGKIPPEARPSKAQVAEMNATLTKLHELVPNTDWPAVARKAAGVPSWDLVTATMAKSVLRTLRGHLAELDYPEAEETDDDQG
jgi:hypothetical protein